MLELKDICFERDGKKILDNVSSVSVYGFTTMFILTNDNKLYIYDDNPFDNVDNYELKLLREDISELGESYFKTINGEYNVFSSRSDLGLIKDESKILYESDDNIYYGTLEANDFKEILYYLWWDNESRRRAYRIYRKP